MGNYIDKIAKRIGERCNMETPTRDEMRLLRIYALLCLVLGEETEEEAVHDAWSVWRAHDQPDHKSLVPFWDLDEETRALDTPYAEAIAAVARSLVRV